MNDKIQFNVRIRPQYARAANIAAALMDAKNDTVVEMAIRVLLGVDDAETVEKRNRVREAWAKMGEKLPSAAIAVGFSTMASGCSERDNDSAGFGAIAQLVEHFAGSEEVEARKQINARAMRARARSRYYADPVKARAKARAWLKSHPEKVREYAKKYVKKAKAICPERFRAYRRKHRKKPYNRIVQNLRSRLREIVRRRGGKVTSQLTGCNAATLKLHLQQQFKRGMAWNNYGNVWVVDHIIPCAKFDLRIKSQQQACFHFTNLQPLWAADNLRKSAKLLWINKPTNPR